MKTIIDEPTKAAVLHAILGAIKPQDVPPNNYDLGGYRVIIDIPSGVSVVRDVGNKGDGTNEKPGEPAEASLDVETLLMFLERTHEPAANDHTVLLKCLRDRAKLPDKAEVSLPAYAVKAIEKYNAELAELPVAPKITKTSAKRNGADRCEITIEAAK